MKKILKKVFKTWHKRGLKPYCHISEQGKGRIGHHSDYISKIPDCFLNVTNRLIAMEYYEQIKQMIPETTINLICMHIQRILGEAKEFHISIIDRMPFTSIKYKWISIIFSKNNTLSIF